jgi:hypothetical protein
MAYLGMVDTPLAMPDLDALDPATLKAMFLLQHSELLSHKAQIEHLQRHRQLNGCEKLR